MKNLREIAQLRWQVLILFVAALIAIGYMTFFVFKFYKNATAFVNRHADDDDQDDDDQEETTEPEPEPESIHASQNGRQPEPQPAI